MYIHCVYTHPGQVYIQWFYTPRMCVHSLRIHTPRTSIHSMVLHTEDVCTFIAYTHTQDKYTFNGFTLAGQGRNETFYLTMHSTHFTLQLYIWQQTYGKVQSDSEKRNLLLPHGLLFPIHSKDSFICTIRQTG